MRQHHEQLEELYLLSKVLSRAIIFTLKSVHYLQRIVNAINDKHRKLNNDWDQALSYASGELKRRADPLRTVDLGERTRLIRLPIVLKPTAIFF